MNLAKRRFTQIYHKSSNKRPGVNFLKGPLRGRLLEGGEDVYWRGAFIILTSFARKFQYKIVSTAAVLDFIHIYDDFTLIYDQ